MTEAVAITDMRLQILELNSAAKQMLVNQEAGMELNLGSDGWESSKPDVLLYLSTGKSFEFRCRIEGNTCLATFTPVIMGDEIAAVYCVISQITEAPVPGNSLTPLIAAFREPLFIMDTEGRIAEQSLEAVSISSSLGFENCTGIQFIDMIAVRHRIRFIEMFKQCRADGSAVPGVLELAGKDGRTVSVRLTLSAIYAPPGPGLFLIRCREQTGISLSERAAPADEPVPHRVGQFMSELNPFAERNTFFSILAGKLSELADIDSVIIFGNSGGKVGVIAPAACPSVLSRRLLSPDYDFHFEGHPVTARQPVIQNEESPDFSVFCKLYRGYSSMLFVPMPLGGEIAGSIAVLRRKPGKMNEQTVSFLKEISAIAGARIQSFQRIEELRQLNSMYVLLVEFLSRFEGTGGQNRLHAALAREFRLLLHAEASYTFFQNGDGAPFVCAASEGKRLKLRGRESHSLPPDFATCVPESVEKTTGRHSSLLNLLVCRSGDVVYIIPHNAGGITGFTATVSAEGHEPGWKEISVAEHSRKHVDYFLSCGTRYASLEGMTRRARLLNLVSEACISGFGLQHLLELLMRYLSDAVPGSEATSCVVRDGDIVSCGIRTFSPEVPVNRLYPAAVEKQIVEVSGTVKPVSVDSASADSGKSALPSSDSNFLLVPVGSYESAHAVIVLRLPKEKKLDYGEMEFAELLSATAVTSARTAGEAQIRAAETAYASSLSAVFAGIISSPAEVPLPASISSELNRFVPHDDFQILASEGEGFVRKAFSLSADAVNAKGTILPVAEIEAAFGNGSAAEQDHTIQLTSLFGSRPGFAIMQRIHDRSGRAGGIVIIWRKSQSRFSAYERRLVRSVLLASSPALCTILSRSASLR